MPDSTTRIILLLIAMAVISQILALWLWGHTKYLWVQGGEAAVTALVLSAFAIRFRGRDPRGSRWPPLLPLAAIAGFGAAKNFCVAAASATPAWLVALLLASVAWFLISSILIWRNVARTSSATRTRNAP